MEIVKNQLTDFLTTDDLNGELQHGFLKRRYCTSCDFTYFDLVILNVDKKKAILMIFHDMTKTPDLVPYDQLLLKTKSRGLADLLYSWLVSHLSGRSQIVSVNGTLSQRQPITVNAIDGSFLGPLHFLLCLTDIV